MSDAPFPVESDPVQTCRVVVVDDSRLFLDAAAAILADLAGVEVVGRAISGLEALELVRRHSPDLVLTDLAMPGMDGLELTRRLVGSVHVVIMTAHVDEQYRAAALAAGAAGFVLKDDLGEHLPSLISEFMAGEEPG